MGVAPTSTCIRPRFRKRSETYAEAPLARDAPPRAVRVHVLQPRGSEVRVQHRRAARHARERPALRRDARPDDEARRSRRPLRRRLARRSDRQVRPRTPRRALDVPGATRRADVATAVQGDHGSLDVLQRVHELGHDALHDRVPGVQPRRDAQDRVDAHVLRLSDDPARRSSSASARSCATRSARSRARRARSRS